jgi:hypothetical protein
MHVGPKLHRIGLGRILFFSWKLVHFMFWTRVGPGKIFWGMLPSEKGKSSFHALMYRRKLIFILISDISQI